MNHAEFLEFLVDAIREGGRGKISSSAAVHEDGIEVQTSDGEWFRIDVQGGSDRP